jgi:general secretion pathway protein B
VSFILEALRKSELERQRQSGPSIAELPVARADRRLPAALIAIGLLLAVNAAVLSWFLLREAPAPAAGPAASIGVEPAPAAPAPTVAALQPHAGTPARTAAEEYAEESVPAMPESRVPGAPDPTLLPEAPAPTAYTEQPPVDVTQQQPAGIAELNVDLHVYAEDPARRAVFINGRRYTEGMALTEGPMLEQITRDGAVIIHRGQRYLLPRS